MAKLGHLRLGVVCLAVGIACALPAHAAGLPYSPAIVGTPTAVFTVGVQSPESGQSQSFDQTPVTFDATSSTAGALGSAIDSYSWSFGDGSTGTGADASHTYTAPGTYTVRLTVVDDAGARKTVSRSVVVADQPPVPAFAVPQGILTVAQPITLDAGGSSDAEGAVAAYAWNFGDGSTGTGEEIAHTYSEPGTYSVTLTVRDSRGQTRTTTHDLAVHAAPEASFAFSPALPRELTTTTFDADITVNPDPATSLSSYRWSFGDGATGSGAHVTHTYARAGTYTVTLAVADALGLTDTTATQVTVAHAVPTAAITTRTTQAVRGQQVRFTGSSSHAADEPTVTYTWRFGDGGSAAGRTPLHAYARAGRYVVTLTVSDSFGDVTTETTAVVVTRRGSVTAVDARAGRKGATMLVSVSSPGTLTVNHRTMSIKVPGTAGVPIHLTKSQLRALRLRHRLRLRVSLRFVPQGGVAGTTNVLLSLQPSTSAIGYVAAIQAGIG